MCINYEKIYIYKQKLSDVFLNALEVCFVQNWHRIGIISKCRLDTIVINAPRIIFHNFNNFNNNFNKSKLNEINFFINLSFVLPQMIVVEVLY
jgi:hypothetical protein